MSTKDTLCPDCGYGPSTRAYVTGFHKKSCPGSSSTSTASLGASNGVLGADLQAAIDLVDETPQSRAKIVRAAFGARGWPNKEYPGTVLDFLNDHNIPIAAPRR